MSLWTEADAIDYAQRLHALYPTKKAKKERAREALYRDALTDGDKRVVIALLGTHPDRAEKIGCGIADIEVRPAMYGTQGFYLLRADGSGTDFSYLKCLTPPTPRDDVLAACRAAIRDDIEKFRNERLARNPICDLTGVTVISNGHVHHAPPMFDVLVDTWAKFAGPGHEVIADACANGDNVYGNQLAEHHRQSWLAFHRTEARLQFVHPTANLGIEALRRKIKAGT